MIAVVVDASAGVEMVTRTTAGQQLALLVPSGAALWVPDGIFDVEVHAVLRRWDLRAVLPADEIAASRLRLRTWRLRRSSVRELTDDAWRLRQSVTFSDGCYVSLAERLDALLLTADKRLARAPDLPVATLHL